MKKKNTGPRVLLYGFSSFGSIRENPSALVVRSLRLSLAGKMNLKTAVFRVSYEEVKNRLRRLLREERFDFVIGFGVCGGRQEFRIETRACNQASKHLPDVDGRRKRSGVISRTGPSFIRSSLGSEKMRRAFKRRGWPAALSAGAGDYLCNYAFYLSGLRAREPGVRLKFGFLHLPLHREYIRRKGLKCPGLPLKTIRQAAGHYVLKAVGSS